MCWARVLDPALSQNEMVCRGLTRGIFCHSGTQRKQQSCSPNSDKIRPHFSTTCAEAFEKEGHWLPLEKASRWLTGWTRTSANEVVYKRFTTDSCPFLATKQDKTFSVSSSTHKAGKFEDFATKKLHLNGRHVGKYQQEWPWMLAENVSLLRDTLWNTRMWLTCPQRPLKTCDTACSCKSDHNPSQNKDQASTMKSSNPQLQKEVVVGSQPVQLKTKTTLLFLYVLSVISTTS